MGEEYLTIKLTLTQLDDVNTGEIEKARFRARIEQSPLGASTGVGWDFKPSPEDWAYIDEFISYMPLRNHFKKQDVVRLGEKIFAWIFKDKVLEKYNQCLGRLTEDVRLRLAIAILSEHLVKIPWEFLHDGNGFLLQSGHLIVRIIDELGEKKAPFSPIKRLLVAIANPGKNDPDNASFSSFDAQTHEQKIVESLKNTGIEYEILNPCIRRDFKDKITGANFDALYFAGHGVFTPDLEGQLILEDDKNNEDYLEATELAEWLRDSNDNVTTRIRFAYLNSCSTARNDSLNTFAGVAQRLMLNGGVNAVVAMQSDIEQTAGFDIAAGFFEEMQLEGGRSPEQALALARASGGDQHSWGVPAMYTYLSGPEDFEKNRLAYFMNAELGKSSYGLFLPTFILGELFEEAAKKSRSKPTSLYRYSGETLSLKDMESGLDVIRLLSRIVPSDEIKLRRSNDQGESQYSHWFIFGSRSNKVVESVLGGKDYVPRFAFDYTSEPGKWTLTDKKLNKVHSIDNPHQSPKDEYDKKDDIGVIEKIVSEKRGRVFFLLSGLGDRATRGCGWYLYQNWELLLGEFGNTPFGIVLRFPGGFGFNDTERLDTP